MEISKTKALRTCDELAKHGVNRNGFYFIDPDGENIGFEPIQVYCTFEQNVGITEIEHDHQEKINVDKCEEVGCFRKSIHYGIHQDQIEALKSLSQECEQSISFGCKHAPLLSSNNHYLGGWLDKSGIAPEIL